jgi:hypothetical protein
LPPRRDRLSWTTGCQDGPVKASEIEACTLFARVFPVGLVVFVSVSWTVLEIVAAGNDVPFATPINEPRPPLPEVVAAVEAARGLRNAGNVVEALQTLDKALALARQAKDQPGEALALNNMASIYRYQAGLNVITADQKPPLDLIDKSTDYYRRALSAARVSGSKFNVGYAELYLGVLEAGRDNADKAFQHYETALTAFKEIDHRYYLARTYLSMGCHNALPASAGGGGSQIL